MAFTLDRIVPWGRSFDEYRRMFALTDAELDLRILGCGDGPASFNAEATRRGARVVSVDPLYAFQADAVEARIAETYDAVMAGLEKNRSQFVWNDFGDPVALGRARMEAMQRFLDDYRTPAARPTRYVQGALPTLPFDDDAFDLALCSHLLFLYDEALSADFHLASVRELLRVAPEVRIFPLLTLAAAPSPHLPVTRAALDRAGFETRITPVPYEFQRGGNEMLVARRVPTGR